MPFLCGLVRLSVPLEVIYDLNCVDNVEYIIHAMNFAVPNREKQVRVQAPFFFSSFARPSLFPNIVGGI
jgi:hypothetical protein